MSEEIPSTDLTLRGAKQFMADKFSAYTIKKGSMYFGWNIWDVKALEEDSMSQLGLRNFRLYTKGLEDDSEAHWDKRQSPLPLPTPESTFANRLDAYIKEKTNDDTIKFGFVVQISESTKKALCNVIMPDKTDKTILVSEDKEKKFSFETLL